MEGKPIQVMAGIVSEPSVRRRRRKSGDIPFRKSRNGSEEIPDHVANEGIGKYMERGVVRPNHLRNNNGRLFF